MMSRNHLTFAPLGVLTALILSAAAFAAEGELAGDLSVTKTDGGFEIAFTLTAPNDVTVRIVDAKGNVVRHLACGMVGLEKAVKPFAAKSLTQKITWNGKDDAGNPVDPKGCKVTIGVGMTAKFDRFVLAAGNGFVLNGRNPRDLIFRGRGDEYYVAQSFGIHVDTIRVFDGSGKFVRALFPYHLGRPGIRDFLDTPSPAFGGRRRTVRHDAVDWDGDRVPVSVAHSDSYYLTPRVAQAVVTTDGHVVATLGYVAGFASLTLWTPEGLPVEHFHPLPWHVGINPPRDAPDETKKLWRSKDKWWLVAGAEGDVYLADGIHHVVAHLRAKDLALLDFTWSPAKRLDKPRNRLGEINVAGDDPDHFTGPDGIALDADGNLLVLDGETVKTYSRDGRFIERKPRAESDFDKRRVPLRDGGLRWRQILKREGARTGSSGVPAKLLEAGKRPGTLAFPHFITVDSTGRLYVLERVGEPHLVTDVDGKNVAPRRAGNPGLGYMCVDAEDNWYVSVQPTWSSPAELRKFSPDGKRLRFGDKDAILPEDVGKRGSIKGVFVARSGDIYLVAAHRDLPDAVTRDREPWPKGEAFMLCRVDLYSPTGELKKKGLVRSHALSDVLVDREGNVYVIDGKLRYKGRTQPTWPPPFFPAEEAKRYAGDEYVNQRKSLMQRLVKFGPAGGVLDGKDGPAQLWDHPGVSGVSPLAGWGHLQPGQMCLDPDERIWVPDTYNYCVKAVDKAGNLILRVGKYGNEECRGGGGDRKLEGTNIVIAPEIPLARPHGMAVYGDHLLIADMFAHRIVRCQLEFTDSSQIDLPH